jgi:DNA-binding GntR family transcriptional regulator
MKKELAHEKAYRSIKELIIDYRFTPGVRINVEKLSRELGVSRVPVWEAIRRLQQEGIVKHIPNRGVFFVENTIESGEELIEVRLQLERLIGAKAARNTDKRRLAKMVRCIEAQYDASEKGDLVAYSRLDAEFHELLRQSCTNRVLLEMLEVIESRMAPIEFHIIDILPELYKEHRAILEGIQTGNADLVDRAIVEHNETLLKQIRRDMRKTVERKEAMKVIGRGITDKKEDEKPSAGICAEGSRK